MSLTGIACSRNNPGQCEIEGSSFVSFEIVVVAALPALGVVIVAGMTRSKFWIAIAAIAAAALGILTGNPTYMGADLLAVGVALCLVWPSPKARDGEASKVQSAATTSLPTSTTSARESPQRTGHAEPKQGKLRKRPERFCGSCRTLVVPKSTLIRRQRCTNCGNVL